MNNNFNGNTYANVLNIYNDNKTSTQNVERLF